MDPWRFDSSQSRQNIPAPGAINTRMRISNITEAVSKVQGTNCGNCIWRRDAKTKQVQRQDLNRQGGIDAQHTEDLANAKASDLVTLPGRGTADQAFFCANKHIKQWVTDRMCCIYWDAPGVHRSWGKMSLK